MVVVFKLDSDGAPVSAGLAGCCWVDEVCTSPGVDSCDEVAETGSDAWSAPPPASTMLGQPDAAGTVLNRSFSALIASSLHS